MDPRPSERGDVVHGEVVQQVVELLERLCSPCRHLIRTLLSQAGDAWRAENTARFLVALHRNLGETVPASAGSVHPRVVVRVLEEASWVEDELLREMWAGLLAAAIRSGDRSDQDVMFIPRLAAMTTLQARLLNYACENAPKRLVRTDWIDVLELKEHIRTIQEVTGEMDMQTLDCQIDHLQSLKLLRVGLRQTEFPKGDITPTCLAMSFYVRCRGFSGSPVEYFGVEEAET
jgi:hypothetical protein